MKRFTLLVAAVGLAAGAALAQPPPGPPAGGRFDLDELAILLDLDAYQKGEVERVLGERRAAMQAEREAMRAAREANAESGERPSRDEMRARREQNRDELFGKLQNTLTEQQLTKLKILLQPPQGGRGPRGQF
jgi:hypothetical protein